MSDFWRKQLTGIDLPEWAPPSVISWDSGAYDPSSLISSLEKMIESTYDVPKEFLANAQCKRCNDGVLKLDFIPRSKDNYCDCSYGREKRKAHELPGGAK